MRGAKVRALSAAAWGQPAAWGVLQGLPCTFGVVASTGQDWPLVRETSLQTSLAH